MSDGYSMVYRCQCYREDIYSGGLMADVIIPEPFREEAFEMNCEEMLDDCADVVMEDGIVIEAEEQEGMFHVYCASDVDECGFSIPVVLNNPMELICDCSEPSQSEFAEVISDEFSYTVPMTVGSAVFLFPEDDVSLRELSEHCVGFLRNCESIRSRRTTATDGSSSPLEETNDDEAISSTNGCRAAPPRSVKSPSLFRLLFSPRFLRQEPGHPRQIVEILSATPADRKDTFD